MSDYLQQRQTVAERLWKRQLKNIIEPRFHAMEAAGGQADLPHHSFAFVSLAVVAWGPAAVDEVTRRIAPLIPGGIAARNRLPKKSSAELGLITLANVVACCGQHDETPTMTSWLSEIRTSKDEEPFDWHWNRAFAALALGRKPLYRALAGVVEDDEPLVVSPSSVFGGNLQGMLRHFAGAVEQGSGFAAIEPAWRDLLANLQRHSEVGNITDDTLFWIARVVHHCIDGAPLGSVAQWLHDELKAA